eukprot:ANDGO_03772.mRNA.1 SWI/SNF-related matrix-associated actin-dependent regulator of chromatin subfamily A-like protein 1
MSGKSPRKRGSEGEALDSEDVFPNCEHGIPAVRKMVRKEGPTQGRFFYACGRFPNGCKFFEWTAAPTSSSTTATATATSSVPHQTRHPISAAASMKSPPQAQPQPGPGLVGSHASRGPPSPPNQQQPWWKKQPSGVTPGIAQKTATRAIPCRVGLEMARLDQVLIRIDPGYAESQIVENAIKVFAAEEREVLENKGRCVYGISRMQYEKLVCRLQALPIAAEGLLKVEDIPASCLKTLENASQYFAKQTFDMGYLEKALPASLLQSMMPFQKEGVLFALQRNGRALIADHPGLGKTIQAIALMYCYRKEWPMCVIVPSSVRFQWKAEILKWLPRSFISEDEIHVIVSASNDKYASHGEEFQVLIVSYDLAAKMATRLAESNFQCFIADEAHYIKNLQAQRTTALLPLLKKAKRTLLLTGTPALSRPIELYTQVQAILPTLFTNKEVYGFRYCNGREGQFGLDFSGSSHLEELHLLLSHFVMIRRQKQEVFSQLPAKRRQRVDLEVSADIQRKFSMRLEQLRELEQMIKGRGSSMRQDERVRFENQRKGALMDLWRDTANAKLKAVLEYVSDLLETGTRFIVFGHHLKVLEELEQMAKKKKVGYILIDGSTSAEKRHVLAEKFRTDLTGCQLAILSMAAAGTGLTLTPCSDVVFAELQWTPGLLFQCEDRVHRIGQVNSVLIRYLIATGTFDDHIWTLLRNKLSVLGKTLEGNAESTKMDVESRTLLDTSSHRIESFFGKTDKLLHTKDLSAGIDTADIEDADDFSLLEGDTELRPAAAPSGMQNCKKAASSIKGVSAAHDDAGPAAKRPRSLPKSSASTVKASPHAPVAGDLDDDFDDPEFDWDSYIAQAEKDQARTSDSLSSQRVSALNLATGTDQLLDLDVGEYTDMQF